MKDVRQEKEERDGREEERKRSRGGGSCPTARVSADVLWDTLTMSC